MADCPSISVVIPAYNREHTVLTAIRSVLWQTCPPAEVIVVDDGSTDRTTAVVEALAEPKVRLIRQPNGGISAARNRGIEAAMGDWVAFQDSDDEWLPTKLQRQFACLAQSCPRPDVVYCGMVISGALHTKANSAAASPRSAIVYHPDSSVTAASGQMLPTLLRTNPISTQTLVARRDVLHKAGLFDPNLKSLVDWDLAIRLAVLGPIAFVDEPLVIQRFATNSVTRDTARRVESWITLLEKHAALFEADRGAHLGHLMRISGGLARLGQHDRAALYRKAARRLDPLSPRLNLLAIASRMRLRVHP